jgi:hypothetical protein
MHSIKNMTTQMLVIKKTMQVNQKRKKNTQI